MWNLSPPKGKVARRLLWVSFVKKLSLSTFKWNCDSKSIILRYYRKSSQHSHSHCMHSNRNPYKCSNWNLAKIFIHFHGLKGVLNSLFNKARHQSQSPTWISLSDKMVLIKEVVVIILFFILWIYSIFLFYRWFQVSFLCA